MALQAGNRTYYNPTHGIDWRGSLLPLNTFYAIMSLCLFFVLALILRLCYKHYRFEIRRAGIKQEEAKKKYERAMANMIQIQANGAPPGILKSMKAESTRNVAVTNDEEEIRKQAERVQFATFIKSEGISNNNEKCSDGNVMIVGGCHVVKEEISHF